jgi:hypothetical protein
MLLYTPRFVPSTCLSSSLSSLTGVAHSQGQINGFPSTNRITWTKNKACKSRMRPNSNCQSCSFIEPMERLLCECTYYSEPLWSRLGNMITEYLNNREEDLVSRVELGPIIIVINIPHLSILLHRHDKLAEASSCYLHSKSRGISSINA